MKQTVNLFYFFTFMLIAGLYSCGSNISHIPHAEDPVATQKEYKAPLDKVWNAARLALSESYTFKVMDKSSGIMVTEFSTVDSKELSLIQISFFGKTYKNSYTVNFVQNAPNSTVVSVGVKLEAVQYALLSRSESNKDVEAYLRKALFDKIDANLGKAVTSS